MVPGHEVADLAVGPSAGEAPEGLGEPGEGIDAVRFVGGPGGVGCPGGAAAIGSAKIDFL